MFSHISTLLLLQKKTGLAVTQRNQLVQELAEDLPQLVWASDEKGKKTYCSRRYLAFTGASDMDEMDRSWTGFIHPDDRAATASNWMHSLDSGEPYSAEYRLRRTDGVFRFVKAQALPSFDLDGHVTGWLGMSRDVTEEKVAEQTREVAAKLAAVSRLASSIAHEINNPLESLTNALYLVSQTDKIDESTRFYLEMADAELRRLASVTTSSLRFHKQAGAPNRVKLSRIVDGVLATYKGRLESARITVVQRYRDDAELLCYADDLAQAITNIVRNAIDAMRSGGTLFVRVRKIRGGRPGDRARVGLTLADTGEGIRPEIRKFLFEPFYTTKGATHSGLALWVTDQIIRKHGGNITFRSSTKNTPHGTAFSIILPINGFDQDCD